MSFAEQLVSNMFDPTNRMVNRMVDQEATNVRNQGQAQLAQGTVAQQSLWTYNARGELVMRDIDEALAIARGITAMNQQVQPQPAQQDLAAIIATTVASTIQALGLAPVTN